MSGLIKIDLLNYELYLIIFFYDRSEIASSKQYKQPKVYFRKISTFEVALIFELVTFESLGNSILFREYSIKSNRLNIIISTRKLRQYAIYYYN